MSRPRSQETGEKSRHFARIWRAEIDIRARWIAENEICADNESSSDLFPAMGKIIVGEYRLFTPLSQQGRRDPSNIENDEWRMKPGRYQP